MEWGHARVVVLSCRVKNKEVCLLCGLACSSCLSIGLSEHNGCDGCCMNLDCLWPLGAVALNIAHRYCPHVLPTGMACHLERLPP
jgi:hypothetical protein